MARPLLAPLRIRFGLPAAGSSIDSSDMHVPTTVNSGPQMGMDENSAQPSSRTISSSADRRMLIDVAALAKELGVTQRFVRRLVAEHRVPFLKIGKFVRFDPREIDEWVDACRQFR